MARPRKQVSNGRPRKQNDLASLSTEVLRLRRPGSAAPVGLNRPLEQKLQNKILRGEYIDFSLLLPDSLAWPQAPDIQLRVDDSSPGSSPVTMVRKRKPVIDSFHRWLDAFTAYALVIVGSHPRRSLELFKYQQIISRTASNSRVPLFWPTTNIFAAKPQMTYALAGTRWI